LLRRGGRGSRGNAAATAGRGALQRPLPRGDAHAPPVRTLRSRPGTRPRMNAPDDHLPPDETSATEPAADASPDVAPASPRLGKVVKEQFRFFPTVLLAALAVLCYYGYAAKTYDVVHLYAGEVILALSILPALLWAHGTNRQFPTFEAYLFTFGNSFAIPLL